MGVHRIPAARMWMLEGMLLQKVRFRLKCLSSHAIYGSGGTSSLEATGENPP